MAPAAPGERTLEFSPTWTLAIVATAFIAVSFVVERLLHKLGHFLHRTKRKALLAALVKIKDDEYNFHSRVSSSTTTVSLTTDEWNSLPF